MTDRLPSFSRISEAVSKAVRFREDHEDLIKNVLNKVFLRDMIEIASFQQEDFELSTLRVVLTILFIIDCVALITVIMMQQGKDRGLGAIAGMSSGDTYWGRNKGRSKEGLLSKLTTLMVIVFVVLAVILNVNF